MNIFNIILVALSIMVCPWLLGNLHTAVELKKVALSKKISLIIPAYNDVVNLRKLLPTLLSTIEDMAQIIVADMGSEDNTASIVRGYGCELITMTDKPDHCSMRNYACYIGAKKAINEILVFMDANLLPGKELFHKLDYAMKKNTVISVLPYDKFEHITSGLSGIRSLVSMMLMGSFALLKKEDAGLFTPFVMIDRHDYFNICTHDMIKESALENITLGQAYKKAGMKIRNFIGGSELKRRVSKSAKQQIPDKGRLIPRGITIDYGSIFLVLLFILGGLSIFYNCLISLIFGKSAVIWLWFYAAIGALYEFYLKKVGNYPIYCALLYPIHMILFAAGSIGPLLKSIKPHKIKWRGRKIKIEKNA